MSELRGVSAHRASGPMDVTQHHGELMVQMKCSDLPMDYHQTLFSHKKNCFTGRDLVIWLVKHREMEFKEAFALAERLLNIGAVVEIKDRKRDFDMGGKYRLIIDTDKDGLLNLYQIGSEDFREVSALEISTKLRSATIALYSTYLNQDGTQVDYERLQRSREFNVDYRNAVYSLRYVNLRDLSDVERKCFFINIYNTLMINGLIVIGKPSGLLQKRNFYNHCKYNIGGYIFSLNDIEHGVLRANRKPVGAIKKLFSKRDARREFIVSEFDPRIHFALNCGAKSCPPIKAYLPDQLDRQLDVAAKNFCDQEIEINDRTVTMSKIFSWYYTDFGQTDSEILHYVCQYLIDKKDQMLSLFDTNSKIKVKFSSYDWSLNEQVVTE
jgi:hypothetical protein